MKVKSRAVWAVILIAGIGTAAAFRSRNFGIIVERTTRAPVDLNTLRKLLAVYVTDNGLPPTQQQGLRALVVRPTIPPIPKAWRKLIRDESAFKDPWGREYVYRIPDM